MIFQTLLKFLKEALENNFFCNYKNMNAYCNSDYRNIFKSLKSQGWEIIQGRNNHYKCIPPDKTKRVVTISHTPSDRRGFLNLIRDLKHSGAKI